jgi:hypothetical protein
LKDAHAGWFLAKMGGGLMNSDDDHPYRHRFQHRTIEFLFGGTRYQLTVATNPNGCYDEVVLSGPRTGSAMSNIAHDACALVNELLNRYVSIETLTELIMRTENGEAESIVGEIILQLAQSP